MNKKMKESLKETLNILPNDLSMANFNQAKFRMFADNINPLKLTIQFDDDDIQYQIAKMRFFLICYFNLKKDATNYISTSFYEILSILGFSTSGIKNGTYLDSSTYNTLLETLDIMDECGEIAVVEHNKNAPNAKITLYINPNETSLHGYTNSKKSFITIDAVEFYSIFTATYRPERKLNLLWVYFIIKSRCYAYVGNEMLKCGCIKNSELQFLSGLSKAIITDILKILESDLNLIQRTRIYKHSTETGVSTITQSSQTIYSYTANPDRLQELEIYKKYLYESIYENSNFKDRVVNKEYLNNTQPIRSVNSAGIPTVMIDGITWLANDDGTPTKCRDNFTELIRADFESGMSYSEVTSKYTADEMKFYYINLEN